MSDSIFQRCLDKIVMQLNPLAEQAVLREIAVRLSVVHGAKAQPALHVIPGDETAAEEDVCGYTCTRPILLKLTFSEYRDPFTRAAQLVAAVQAALESDATLGGIAVKWVYRGEQPFITEATQPLEGTFLHYELVYRRKSGQPDQGY